MKVFLRNTEECEVYIAKVEKALRKAGIEVVKKTDATNETDGAEMAHLCIDVRKGGQLKKEPEYWKHMEKVREQRLKDEQDMRSVTIDKVDARVCRLVKAIGKMTVPRTYILDALGLQQGSRRVFIYHYLKPAVAKGYVVMAHPAHPKLPEQAYRLTANGLDLLAQIIKSSKYSSHPK